MKCASCARAQDMFEEEKDPQSTQRNFFKGDAFSFAADFAEFLSPRT